MFRLARFETCCRFNKRFFSIISLLPGSGKTTSEAQHSLWDIVPGARSVLQSFFNRLFQQLIFARQSCQDDRKLVKIWEQSDEVRFRLLSTFVSQAVRRTHLQSK
jgi:hypothetical protein